MRLFDFLKGRSDKAKKEQQAPMAMDDNSYLLETLKSRLVASGYQVDRHSQYLALIVNSELEIATAIIDNPNNHPSILHLMVLTIHPKYFPNGIEENIMGVGISIQDKVKSVLNNYINTTFSPIIESFSDRHNPALDFSTITNNGKEILWHPKLGDLTFQGQWQLYPQDEPLFEMLKNIVKQKLTSNKINWLKIYLSKRADGTIIGECKFNNEPWEDGLKVVTEYAKEWKVNGDFMGVKQFIVFRRCDAFDNQE